MTAHESVETVLRLPRLLSTVLSARSFSRKPTAPASTDGHSQFKMRSAMDLHPGTGKWISRRAVRCDQPGAGTVTGTRESRFVDDAEIDTAVDGIRSDGFYVFRRTVTPDITDAIRSFAEQAPCTGRGIDAPRGPYPRHAPLAGRYDIDETTALQCAEVQEFATDPAMALIAQRYLGQPVIMDEVATWWTTAQRSQDADVNAQLFHQDRDRLSFLKFFIYLTDVTSQTGPHIYLKGSHREIPRALRGDGRKSDEAVREAGLWDNVTELCGPAGTLMAVDTIGLHKGKTPISGDRLALENEFATSLFGADYEVPIFTPSDVTRRRYADMPWILQRYRASVTG